MGTNLAESERGATSKPHAPRPADLSMAKDNVHGEGGMLRENSAEQLLSNHERSLFRYDFQGKRTEGIQV